MVINPSLHFLTRYHYTQATRTFQRRRRCGAAPPSKMISAYYDEKWFFAGSVKKH